MLTKEFKDIKRKFQDIIDYNNCEVKGIIEPKFSHLFKNNSSHIETIKLNDKYIATVINDGVGNRLSITMNIENKGFFISAIIQLPKAVVASQSEFRKIISNLIYGYINDGIYVDYIGVFDMDNTTNCLLDLKCFHNNGRTIVELADKNKKMKDEINRARNNNRIMMDEIKKDFSNSIIENIIDLTIPESERDIVKKSMGLK